MKILKEMHPEVNFEKEQNLVGDMILDSFDLVSLISEVEEAYEVRISQKILFRRTLIPPGCVPIQVRIHCLFTNIVLRSHWTRFRTNETFLRYVLLCRPMKPLNLCMFPLRL